MTRVLLGLILIAELSIGQIDSTESQIPDVSYLQGSGGLIIGGHFIGKTITGELGYIKSNVTKVKDYREDIRDSALLTSKMCFWGEQPYSAISVGSEFFLNGDNRFCVGPKIGFAYSVFFIFHARLNLTYYTNLSELRDFRISPALGFSLGFINIMYNFNYSLLKNHFDNIAKNRISMIFYVAKKQ